MRLPSEPACRALSTQEEERGDPGNNSDRERKRSRQPDRAADLTRDKQRHKRDERKHEPADRREHERAQRCEPGRVRRVASATEVAELHDARARRREQLTCKVRGEVRLASTPQTKPWQERSIHQGFRGNARKPEREQTDHLPPIEFGERFPDLVVVDELRQEPREYDHERRQHQRGSEQALPQRPRRGSGMRVLHGFDAF